MKLKYQLFLTLLLASALLIALMFTISSWSFSRGFLGYINSAQQSRLEPVVLELQDIYEERGGWQGLDQDKSLWRDMVRGFDSNNLRGSARGARGQPSGTKSSKEGESRGPRPPPKRGPSTNSPPRLILADESKNLLLGRMSPSDIISWQPLVVQEKTIGFLGYRKLQRLDRQFDQAFERQQRKSFGVAALAMVLLSALLSIPLAARIVKPLLTVNRAVSEISNGNYGHRANLQRKDEFKDLANDINRLGTSLEKNRDARQRWIAEISHELRTPVAVMRSELEAMQDGIREANDAAINSLHSEVLSLGRLIDDLHTLSLSDVGALEYKMEPVDLADLISRVLQSNSPKLEALKLQVAVQKHAEKAVVDGDIIRLEQLFSNLLQNTLRYTEPGGTLGVDINIREASKTLVISWQDTKPGVDDAALSQLFNPLFRTEESRNRKTGGAGLGLSIVSKIAQAHNASIVAQQADLGGLQLDIEFPLHREVIS